MGLALLVVATLFLFVVVCVTVAAVRNGITTAYPDDLATRIAAQRVRVERPRTRHPV